MREHKDPGCGLHSDNVECGDLEEVLGMSDRIGVMFEGRLVAMLDRNECTPERLGLLMAGESDGTE